MNNKNKIVLFLFSLLLATGLYLYFGLYNSTYTNIDSIPTEIKISSSELISSFIHDEKNANSTYRDKIIEVEGLVKEVTFLNNRNTVLLHGDNIYSSVLCDMHANQTDEIKTLRKGQKIMLKGVCKGFLKDVILLHCTLIKTKIDE